MFTDYRDLLIKYIRHMEEYEGSAALSGDYQRTKGFTDEEWTELKHLGKEALDQ